MWPLKYTLLSLVAKIEKLLNRPNKNGFIEKNPETGHWIHNLGNAIKKIEIKPDKNWFICRPRGERQKRGKRETMACVTFSACNCIETLIGYYIFLIESNFRDIKLTEKQQTTIINIVKIFRSFGLIDESNECNISDRYIAKLSGTTPRGNSQQNVAEAIRKYGLVPEYMWPFDEDNYYADIPQEIIDKGQEFLKYIEINHEWVNPVDFSDTLKYGPIQTSVFAWPNQVNGIYQRTETARNHAVDHDCFQDEYKGIFDSYESFNKKVANNFNLGWGKLFLIRLNEDPFDQKEINKLIERGFKYIMRSDRINGGKGEFYELSKEGLIYKNQDEARDIGIRTMAEREDVTGISEADFDKLIK